MMSPFRRRGGASAGRETRERSAQGQPPSKCLASGLSSFFLAVTTLLTRGDGQRALRGTVARWKSGDTWAKCPTRCGRCQTTSTPAERQCAELCGRCLTRSGPPSLGMKPRVCCDCNCRQCEYAVGLDSELHRVDDLVHLHVHVLHGLGEELVRLPDDAPRKRPMAVVGDAGAHRVKGLVDGLLHVHHWAVDDDDLALSEGVPREDLVPVRGTRSELLAAIDGPARKMKGSAFSQRYRHRHGAIAPDGRRAAGAPGTG